MFNSMNRIFLTGKTSHKFAPEMKTTPGGTAVLRFTMATTRLTKDKEGNKKRVAEYHRVVIYGKLAEVGEKHIKTETLLTIIGELRQTKWTDAQGQEKSGYEIVANDFVVLDSTPWEERKGASTRQEEEPDHIPHSSGDYDDDIPF